MDTVITGKVEIEGKEFTFAITSEKCDAPEAVAKKALVVLAELKKKGCPTCGK